MIFASLEFRRGVKSSAERPWMTPGSFSVSIYSAWLGGTIRAHASGFSKSYRTHPLTDLRIEVSIMKRLLRGSVVLAVAVGFLSCSGDPTSDLRQPAGIIATPTTVFVDVGETKPVIASLQDEQGNQIASDFTITDVGAGITVVQD